MTEDSDNNPNDPKKEHAGSDPVVDKKVFVKVDGIMMGPFSEAELAAKGIHHEPEKEDPRKFVYGIVSTMNGVREEHIEIGMDILWAFGELKRRGLPSEEVVVEDAILALRAGDEAELQRLKAIVTKLLERDSA